MENTDLAAPGKLIGMTMKTALKIAALTLGLTTFAAAHAQTGLYAGVGVAQVQYKEDGFQSLEPTAITFRVGSQLNPNFAVEARLGTGLSDGSGTFSGIPISAEIDNFYGVYAKGIIPVTSWFAPYAMVGYTHAKVTARAGGFSASNSDSDFSYGIGADFPVSKNIAINLEYARLFAGDGYNADAISLGVAYKF